MDTLKKIFYSSQASNSEPSNKMSGIENKIFSLATAENGPCNPTIISDYLGLRTSIKHIGNFFVENNVEQKILDNQVEDKYKYLKQRGESCELALYIENYYLEQNTSVANIPYIFATGEISEDGRVEKIGGIIAKLVGAYYFADKLNINNNNSYIFIPLKNKKLAEETINKIKKESPSFNLKIFYVENTEEVNHILEKISKEKDKNNQTDIFNREEPFLIETIKTLFLNISSDILNNFLKEGISSEYFFEILTSFIAAKRLNKDSKNTELIEKTEKKIIETILVNDLLENFLNLTALLLFDKKEALESTSQKEYLLLLIEKLANHLENKKNIVGIETYVEKINQFLTIFNYYSNFIKNESFKKIRDQIQKIKNIKILNYNIKNEEIYNNLINSLKKNINKQEINDLTTTDSFSKDSFSEFQNNIKNITVINKEDKPLTTELITQFQEIKFNSIEAIEKFSQYQKANNLEENCIFLLNNLLYGYQISEESIDEIKKKLSTTTQNILDIFSQKILDINAEYLKIRNNSLDLDHIFDIILKQVKKKDAIIIWATFIHNIEKGFIELDAPLYKQAYKKFLLKFLNSDNLSIEEDLSIAQYCLESIINIKEENDNWNKKSDLVSLYSNIFSILMRKNEKNTFFILYLFYQARQVITDKIAHGTIFWEIFFKEHFFTKNSIAHEIIIKEIILTIINNNNHFCFDTLVAIMNENNYSFILQFLVDSINTLSLENQIQLISFFHNQAIKEINPPNIIVIKNTKKEEEESKNKNKIIKKNNYFFDILFLFSRTFLQNKNAANDASTLYTLITLENGYEKNLTYTIKQMFLEFFIQDIFDSMIEKDNLVNFLEKNEKSNLLAYGYLSYFYDTKNLIHIISKLSKYSFYPIYRLSNNINENKKKIEKGIEVHNIYLENYFYRLKKIYSESNNASDNIQKIIENNKDSYDNKELSELQNDINKLEKYVKEKESIFEKILKDKLISNNLAKTLLQSTTNINTKNKFINQ